MIVFQMFDLLEILLCTHHHFVSILIVHSLLTTVSGSCVLTSACSVFSPSTNRMMTTTSSTTLLTRRRTNPTTNLRTTFQSSIFHVNNNNDIIRTPTTTINSLKKKNNNLQLWMNHHQHSTTHTRTKLCWLVPKNVDIVVTNSNRRYRSGNYLLSSTVLFSVSSTSSSSFSHPHHFNSKTQQPTAIMMSSDTTIHEPITSNSSSASNFPFINNNNTNSYNNNVDDTAETTNVNMLSNIPFHFPIYYNDVYEVKLPPNHRFPMEKYTKVRLRVQKKIQQLQLQLEQQQQQKIESTNLDTATTNPTESMNQTTTTTTPVNGDNIHGMCIFTISPLATVPMLQTTHCASYIDRFITGSNITEKEIRNVGFPWSPSGVNRALSSVGGTVAAAEQVCQILLHEQQQQIQKQQQQQLQKQQHLSSSSSTMLRTRPVWGGHLAGGTHHAFYDYGEGFCVFSDIAVACNVLLQNYSHFIKNILIIDLDVHQGNGNAVLFQNNPNVTTFSIHCSGNYFSTKQSSDLDIELPINCSDETYLLTLKYWLNQFKRNQLEMKKNQNKHDQNDSSNNRKYDIVFYQAGVDVLDCDRLGRMKLTKNGIRQRNELVYQFVYELNLPLIITMGGGYPRGSSSSSSRGTKEGQQQQHAENDEKEKHWEPILDAHANVYIQAYEFLNRMDVINKKYREK